MAEDSNVPSRVAEVCCGCVELEGARAREIPFAFHHLTFFLVRLMLSRVDSSAFCAMCGEPSEAERIHGVKFTETRKRPATGHRPPPGPARPRLASDGRRTYADLTPCTTMPFHLSATLSLDSTVCTRLDTH